MIAAIEPVAQRAQVLALRDHETFQAVDRLAEILVFVFGLERGIRDAHQGRARQVDFAARRHQVLGGGLEVFKHRAEGIGHE